MPDERVIPLSRMVAGQSGRVVQVQGGQGMINRLSALGIRPGKRVTKISSVFMRGPVTIQVGNGQVAIGYGMAKRIVVDLGQV
jgi:ferrous iron transport protein A